MSIYDNMAKSLIKQAEPLIVKYLPEVRKAVKEAVKEAMDEWSAENQHPIPVPPPPEPPRPDPPPSPPRTIVIADMDKITDTDDGVPGMMSKAGFLGRPGAQCYALACTYRGDNWAPPARREDGSSIDPEMQILSDRRDEIYKWWDNYVLSVGAKLKANPQSTAIIIANDGNSRGFDKLGCRLGPPTLERLKDYASQVTIGDIFPEDQYK